MAIKKDITVTVENKKSIMSDDVWIYQGDKNIDIYFTIVDTRFEFSTTTPQRYNFTIRKPDGDLLPMTEITSLVDNKIHFAITEQMTDEFDEIGMYDILIHLYDDLDSRVSIPEIAFEVKQPLMTTNALTNSGFIQSAILEGINEKLDRLDDNGNYIKTTWNKGDLITNENLNKIENQLSHLSTNNVDITSQLDGKANETDVRKKIVKLEPEDLSERTLSAISGNTSLSLLSIPQNKSVGHEKTTFLKTGKNLFDKTTRLLSMVVSDVDGTTSSDLGTGYDTSDYIPISGGITYFINKVRKYALYDINKSFKTGLNNTSYGSATFKPTVDGYLRFYVGKSFVDTTQVEIGTVATNFESFKYETEKLKIGNSNLIPSSVGKENLQVSIIEDKHVNPSSNIVMKKLGKNLLDMSKVTSGYYVDYTSGNLIANALYSVSEYIPVSPKTTYTLHNPRYNLEQFAFYDSNRKFISGWWESLKKVVTFTTNETVHYVRLTLRDSVMNDTQLELGSVATEFEPYNVQIKVDELEKNKITSEYLDPSFLKQLKITKIIEVSPDGTKQYMNLRSALESITDASVTKQYEVHIYEGVYDIMSYYTTEEINNTSFIGLIKPDYVSIVGIGNKDNVILKGELADTFSNIAMKRVSTLVTYGNGGLKNITITAKNLRYAVHDDYNFPNSRMHNKDCSFYKYKTSVFSDYPQSYGEGCWSGTEHIFENCYFYTDTSSYSYSFHNNINFTKPSSHKFINCEFDNKGSTTAVAFLSMGSGQKDNISMVGCRMKGKIQLSENITGVGCDFELTGFGNDIVPYTIAVTDGKQYVYNLQGEHLKVHNGDTAIITKGTPVKLALVSNNSGVKAFTTTDDQSILLGIAFQDIAVGESGIIRIAGYLNVADTTLMGLVDGDKIGIVNGVLSKVTNGDYIGVVVWGNWIKLKI